LMVEQAMLRPEIDEVYAETSVDNIASRRVVEKVGFTHIGQRESEHDGRVDQWLFSRETSVS
jgi:RimJ/RimL family protein N-acetyltransferase